MYFSDYNNEFDALRGVDWEREGGCISNNTHLEEISLADSGACCRRSPSQDDFRNAAAFFEAIARNISITTYDHWDCYPLIGLMFECLAPRFGNGLRKLNLVNVQGIDALDVRLFVSALQKCGRSGSTLEHINIGCCRMVGYDDDLFCSQDDDL